MIKPYYTFAPVTWSTDERYRGVLSISDTFPYHDYGNGTAYTSIVAYGLVAPHKSGDGWGAGQWQHGNPTWQHAPHRGDGAVFSNRSVKS
jgi:hypothetical protein